MDSRSSQRRKKSTTEIWVRVLVIIALFFIAGIGGYLFGGLPQKGEQKSGDGLKQSVDQGEQIKTMALHQPIKLSTGLSINFIQLSTEPQVKGPNCPIGVVAEVTNHTSKKKELPYKYLLNLSINKKQASSVGIYSFDSIQSGIDPTAYTAKLMPGETAKVVYLFSMSNQQEWQTAKEGTLKLRDNGSEYHMTVPIFHNGEEGNYVAQQSVSNTAVSTDNVTIGENTGLLSNNDGNGVTPPTSNSSLDDTQQVNDVNSIQP